MTMTTIFSGGAVATKPATATTRHNSQLAVRASMDLEKVVAAAAETTNTQKPRWQLTSGGYTPVKDPSAREYFQVATFAVSEYNKQNKACLTLESVFSVETQVVAGVNYGLGITARDERGISNNYEAIVFSRTEPTSLHLTYFHILYQ
ncbi:hypothetical protein SASPL_139196 [Salvia splendens]|uniref:Cystatin domain-containing protein n=1 Tax=Salvia splendens TaxID=180675 RepID=A0A8X8WYB2_SALSN|nr:hypothetical protein SASPL_139186 [Salvia splendens]KAG6402318.1 hypothetical protein SASPL_139196 [Salvia splendens]